MKYWRMAMRDGVGGPNRFPDCRQRGIAALDFFIRNTNRRVVADCRELTIEEYGSKWRKLALRFNTQRCSLQRLWSEMKCGDIIFAKFGPRAIGKGIITAEYAFDPNILRDVKEMKLKWAHFVRVQWEKDFIPFQFSFSAPNYTVRRLEGDELKEVLRAEKAARIE